MDIIKTTKRLISTPSVYPEEGKISSVLRQLLTDAGCTVRRERVAAGRYNLYGTKGSGDRSILFYGHMDTVPVVRPNDWQTDPFRPVLKDGKLYGLGAYDMKSGIAAFLSAIARSEAYVKVFLACDEENISAGAWHAVHHNATFFRDVHLVISAEPNFGFGLNGVTVGRSGRCIFTLTIEGAPVHIAQFQDGADACMMLGAFLMSFYTMRDSRHQAIPTVLQVRKVEAESIGMSVCGQVIIEIEALLAAGDEPEAVISAIRKATGYEPTLKPRPTPYLTGYMVDEFPYQDAIADIIAKTTGTPMQRHIRHSVGDDNVMASLGLPVITWGPDGANAHSPNECVDVQSLRKLESMYYDVLMQAEASMD